MMKQEATTEGLPIGEATEKSKTLGRAELVLPEGWVTIFYGIPEEQTDLRNKVRELVKEHGLHSQDLGGSVYVGPESPQLDDKLEAAIQEVEKKAGRPNLVRLIRNDVRRNGDRVYLRDKIVDTAMQEMHLVEFSIDELEKALTPGSGVVIKDKKGKPRDLLSTGYARLNNGKKMLEDVEAVVLRFQGEETLEKEAEKLHLRCRQVTAWVERVDKFYKRWADGERVRRKADRDAKKAEGGKE